MVKIPSAQQEMRVRSLGEEDPLKEGMATHSSILALENPMDRGAGWAAAHGSQRVGHNLANKQQRALGRGDRDHLCAKCSILVDLRILSVTTFGYQVKNHILHLAFFLGFIEASFVSSSCLPFGLCPQ